MEICGENGIRYEREQVAGQFLEHFQGFLGKKDNVTQFTSDNVIVTSKLLSEEADYLERQVTEKEVKDAMFDIEDSKAPRPDGFTSKFFKSGWNIVGNDVVFIGCARVLCFRKITR